jgi:hypothetical protein
LNAGLQHRNHWRLVVRLQQSADGSIPTETSKVNGGTIIALGSRAPETAIDCDNNQNFTYRGGPIVAISEVLQTILRLHKRHQVVITYAGKLESGAACSVEAQNEHMLAYSIPSYYSRRPSPPACLDELQAASIHPIGRWKAHRRKPFQRLAFGQPVYDGEEQLQAEITSRVTPCWRSLAFDGIRR